MRTLSIDIETYSSADLKSVGVYNYVQASDFEILLFAFKVDDQPVQIIDFAQRMYGSTFPELVIRDEEAELIDTIKGWLIDASIKKTAYNANFERTCIAKYFGIELPPEQWECTAVKASMLGLPLHLEAVAKALKLEQEKNTEGKALIKYFSIPCKPTKVNGERTRNLPVHDLEKWERFKDYCVQDVIVEDAIRKAITFFNIIDRERRLWQLDQRINDRGILLDPAFVQNAIRYDNTYREKLNEEAVQLTGLNNSNSAQQLKSWLEKEMPLDTIEKLRKQDLPVIKELADGYINADKIKRLITIRSEMAKTSVKKYVAMAKCICPDQRVRGLLQFYGANRTGRWAGRLVQVQNLPKNDLKDLDLARRLVAEGNMQIMEILFGNVPNTLSQLIRTAFIAPKGSRFFVSDFSAIEAVVIAWLSGEQWRLKVFNTHGRIYEASAAQMFRVPIETISYVNEVGETVEGPNYSMRAKGKVSELALGYNGGPNALINMGALKMGVVDEALKKGKLEVEFGGSQYKVWDDEAIEHYTMKELAKIVRMWRNESPKIVQLWRDCQNAAVSAIEGTPVTLQYGIRFIYKYETLFIVLPSGRALSYFKPRLTAGEFGPVISYQGVDQVKKTWGYQTTYGGKLVENIVQAIARDCLGEALLNIDKAGYKIVMHVHDEIVAEVPEDFGSLGEITEIMCRPISWAPGLPLSAKSYKTSYYKKD